MKRREVWSSRRFFYFLCPEAHTDNENELRCQCKKASINLQPGANINLIVGRQAVDGIQILQFNAIELCNAVHTFAWFDGMIILLKAFFGL